LAQGTQGHFERRYERRYERARAGSSSGGGDDAAVWKCHADARWAQL